MSDESKHAGSSILNKYYYPSRISNDKRQAEEEHIKWMLERYGKEIREISASEIQRSSKLIGSGGFAQIYLGSYRNRTVALKEPNSSYSPLKRARTLRGQFSLIGFLTKALIE